jgi:hypothetical protein
MISKTIVSATSHDAEIEEEFVLDVRVVEDRQPGNAQGAATHPMAAAPPARAPAPTATRSSASMGAPGGGLSVTRVPRR